MACRQDGQALVELALVIPVLLVLLLGIVEFGRAINFWNQNTQAAELAARYVAVGTAPDFSPPNFPVRTNAAGSTCSHPSDLLSLVTYEACLDSEPAPSSVYVCYPTNAVGQTATVTVKYTYHWLPFLSSSIFQPTLTGSATMRLDNQITGTWVPASSCPAS